MVNKVLIGVAPKPHCLFCWVALGSILVPLLCSLPIWRTSVGSRGFYRNHWTKILTRAYKIPVTESEDVVTFWWPLGLLHKDHFQGGKTLLELLTGRVLLDRLLLSFRGIKLEDDITVMKEMITLLGTVPAYFHWAHWLLTLTQLFSVMTPWPASHLHFG